MTVESSSLAFLWPGGIERPALDAFVPQSGGWWDQFYSGIATRGQLSDAALRELTSSSRGIASALANPANWDKPTPWKSLIVGAVQSGKTQSMMGVTAVALDVGYRIVIILAGLKDDLREQTARRFNTQLLLQNDYVPGTAKATTLGGRIGAQGKMRAFASPYNLDCHDNSVLLPKLVASLKDGLSAVIVVKKLPTSLNDLRGVLAAAYEELGVESLPTLILDDECDEASVPGGGATEDHAVPEAITNLWQGLGVQPRVSYVGYTATAAANLLQDPDWPLYPHAVGLLRFPGPTTTELQFQEPTSDSWYSGGDCFYEEFGASAGEESNFLVSPTVMSEHLMAAVHENPSLIDACRAFFVGGAYRLALNPERTFDKPEMLPRPHSLMIHTSPAQEDHSKWFEGILRLFGRRLFPDGVEGLDAAVLVERLRAEEPLWKAWYEKFTASRARVYDTRPHVEAYKQPSWPEVKDRLSMVFANTRVKVVNSNAKGDSLDYEASRAPDGSVIPPRDIYVIAIGGSRLSRGITVQGLGISYFARRSLERHEDTVQQMSRWFGYRGPFIEFCRVFTLAAAYDELREMNSNDLTLRHRLAQLMREGRDPAYATIVFRASPYVMPTKKLGAGAVRDLTFSPYTRVLADVRYGQFAETNLANADALVKKIRSRGAVSAHTDSGVQRGFFSANWSALEVADILDAIQFEHHNPSPEKNLLGTNFRAMDPSRPASLGLEPRTDPYHVAAYLRRWAAEPPPKSPPPKFNVGVSYGSLNDGTKRFDFPLLDRQISADDKVQGSWTSRSANWAGDWYFDGIPDGLRIGKTERERGADGLLLLHVVHKDALGKAGGGKGRTSHTPFFGISIPAGGPIEIRVVSKTRGV